MSKRYRLGFLCGICHLGIAAGSVVLLGGQAPPRDSKAPQQAPLREALSEAELKPSTREQRELATNLNFVGQPLIRGRVMLDGRLYESPAPPNRPQLHEQSVFVVYRGNGPRRLSASYMVSHVFPVTSMGIDFLGFNGPVSDVVQSLRSYVSSTCPQVQTNHAAERAGRR